MIVTVLTNQNAMIDSTAVHVTARKVGRAFAAVSHNLHSSATYSLQQRDKSEVLAHIYILKIALKFNIFHSFKINR